MRNKRRFIFHSFFFMLLIIILFQNQAWSAEPSKVLKLDDITVREQSNKVSPAPPSATILTGEELQDIHVDKTLYLLEKIPGVAIKDYCQGAVASQFVMRGLRLGHNTGAAIFVDGVPLNESTSHGDGYADFNVVIPEDIAYVEVIKGPSSALYGQFARAGVVNIVTKRKGDFSLYKFGFGDWDRQRFAMSTGHEDGALSKVFGAELYRREGATENSGWLRGNVTGKFTYDFNEDLTGSLALNLNSMDWEAPEYLSQDQWDAKDYWSGKPQGGGEKYRYGGSANLTYDVTDDDFVNLMFYAYRSNLTRYRDKDTHADEEYHDRDIYGGSASYVWNTLLGAMENSLTVGIDTQLELTHTINAENENMIRTARQEITVDGDSTLNTYSVFFQNQLIPTEAWKITVGGRYDHMDGELEDKVKGTNTDMEDQDIFSPKAAVEFTPLSGYTVFATYGEGFRLPSGFDKFMYPDLESEEYKQYELGFKLNPIQSFQATLTGFILDVEDEIVTDVAADTKVNEGNTRRKGIELELDYYPMEHFELYGNVSYTKGEYKDYVDKGTDYSGSDIDLIPDWIYSLGVQWKPLEGFFAGFDYRYVGEGYKKKYAVGSTEPKKKTIDYWVADAQIGYQYKSYSVTLDATNIFDERYPAYESGSTYRTANPRGFFVTFALTY
ncbi:MAG: TonB-dependent receptor [Desulfobacteraceae bacterium]|nr:TonB-dependent receptor [Desulfobacteraceae bacterium]MBC2720836.1 TonB-dependent receptor [Desulfobacteraceae bacterium]